MGCNLCGCCSNCGTTTGPHYIGDGSGSVCGITYGHIAVKAQQPSAYLPLFGLLLRRSLLPLGDQIVGRLRTKWANSVHTDEVYFRAANFCDLIDCERYSPGWSPLWLGGIATTTAAAATAGGQLKYHDF